MTDGKIRQLGTAILDALNFQTQIGQGIGDLVNGRCGIEVLFQPGKREFHVFGPLNARWACNGKDRGKVQARRGHGWHLHETHRRQG